MNTGNNSYGFVSRSTNTAHNFSNNNNNINESYSTKTTASAFLIMIVLYQRWIYLFEFNYSAGKQRHIRLMPTASLENERIDCVKLEENRGCTLICTGTVGQLTILCVACKRTIFVYDLNKTKQRYRKVKDIQCPGPVQFIDIQNERLFVGYPSSFAIYSVQTESAASVIGQFVDMMFFWMPSVIFDFCIHLYLLSCSNKLF